MNAHSQLRLMPSLAKTSLLRDSIIANRNHTGRRIVIDYSSPNIAKPFHFGHLKSTILGNFLSNLYKFYGHTVTRLNYVGDWGTQYGLLSLGLDGQNEADLMFTDENQSALELLVNIYVEANRHGEEDENFYQRARQRFRSMDKNEDIDQITRWRHIREVSLKELKRSYEALGIHFDSYEYESDYAKASRDLVERMKSRALVKRRKVDGETNADQPWVIEVIKNNKIIEVPMLKSDETGLYITRDVAAAVSRHSRYNFDEMLYVAGADQERHFHCLREIVKRTVEADWAEQLIHIKTGKVIGMSSRSGNFILLSKMIDEATVRFVESTMNTPTSKVFQDNDIDRVGRHLAVSSLFVYDMRNKRTRDYKFDWDQVMLPSSRSGLQLQASYARLCSLHEKALEERGLEPYLSFDEIDYGADPFNTKYTTDATELITCLNEFPKHLDAAYKAADACPIVDYAFKLCKLTNRARRNELLQVIKESNDKRAISRLTLFNCSRDQLEFIIRLIGLKPLRQI